MIDFDPQVLTFAEATVLLASNVAGAGISALAWGASDTDVRVAQRWVPPGERSFERTRLRHNLCVVAEDARYGEAIRFWSHILIGIIGVFWLVTPQPTNPAVVWWAVLIRFVALVLACLLISKTIHHLIARWRFDRPGSSGNVVTTLWPAIRQGWRDWRDRS